MEPRGHLVARATGGPPGGWSRAPCRSSPGLRVVLPLEVTWVDGHLSPGVAQDHEYLKPMQPPQRSVSRCPSSWPEHRQSCQIPKIRAWNPPLWVHPAAGTKCHPSLYRSCWHECGSGGP